MKSINNLILLTIWILVVMGCQPDEIKTTTEDKEMETVFINEDISTDSRWEQNTIYQINNFVSLRNNAVLTIEPGTIVKFASNEGLIVERGSQIMAEGTIDQPIIFTSTADSIEVGQTISPNLSANDTGLWAGVFILGGAPISSLNGIDDQYYSLPDGDQHRFGGDNSDESSGTLKYVSIRHAGAVLVEDEEPSGLNLGGVGSGTLIEYIEAYACLDDGININGGTVNLKHIITSNYGDDGLDIDRGWQGSLENLICIGGNNHDFALELDGGKSDANPTFTIKNISAWGRLDKSDYISFRSNVKCLVENAYFFGFTDAQVVLRTNQVAENWINSEIDLMNIQFSSNDVNSLEGVFLDKGSDDTDAFEVRVPDASIVDTPTTGAAKSEFLNWTQSDADGSLSEF